MAEDLTVEGFGDIEVFLLCCAGDEEPLLVLPGALGKGLGETLLLLLFFLVLIGAGNSTEPLTD